MWQMKISKCFVQILLLQVLAAILHVQAQTGFISLDCGSVKGTSYTDKTTNIVYISDEKFIETGVSKSIKPEYRQQFQQQGWSVRSFPQGKRNCYKFDKLKKGDRYLIRASFLYGDYDDLNQNPRFAAYIGPNFWNSVVIDNATSPLVLELVHLLPSTGFHVCLVKTGDSIPFISSLELRLLSNETYITQTGSLQTYFRMDLGSTTNVGFRFDKDIFDRTWEPRNSHDWTQLSTSNPINTNLFHPPDIAMQTAVTPVTPSEPLTFNLTPADNTTSEFYVFMHVVEIQELQANESREFVIKYNGRNIYGPITPNYLSLTTIFTPTSLGPQNGTYHFSIERTENSTLPPLLNAIEVYQVKFLPQSDTDQNDVNAMMNIKSVYGMNMVSWQGDPCAPREFVWNGLECTYKDFNPPRVTTLNLSSGGLKGDIPPSIINLTLLTTLDLSNNNLSGSVPEFLSQLTSLTIINLSGNKLSGSVPQELIDRTKDGSLKLRVEGNPDLCQSDSCPKSKGKKSLLVPILVLVALMFVLVAAVTIFLIYRKRKQRLLPDTKNNNILERNLEAKNRQFSYSKVLKITNNLERILGKGGFGMVYHGHLDDTQVAVKVLSASSAQGYKEFKAEVQLLLRVHHRNLVTLIGYCHEGDKLALIYEFMPKGDLNEHLSVKQGSNILSWENRLRIATETAQGLEYLHNGCRPNIVHRDVKTSNILLGDNFNAKLADFGLSRSFPIEGGSHVPTTLVAGTPGYLDPEYYLTTLLTEKSDVYSFGVVLMEIITNKRVIDSTREKSHISDWVRSMIDKGDINTIVGPLLQGCFNVNSAWKAIEVALACVSPTSSTRPTMTYVVTELNECLVAEKARIQGNVNDSIELNLNITTQLQPTAK